MQIKELKSTRERRIEIRLLSGCASSKRIDFQVSEGCCALFSPKVIKNESQLRASGNQIRQQPQEKLPVLSLHLNVFICLLFDLLIEVSKHDWHAHDFPLPLSERFAVRQTHCGESVDTGKKKARDREQLCW